jgi:hypothetical protein
MFSRGIDPGKAGHISVPYVRVETFGSGAPSVYETEGHWFESSRAHFALRCDQGEGGGDG